MSENKQAGGKVTLANDTSAFRRTVLWCSIAAAIHIVIIGGVSAGQWIFKGSGEVDKKTPATAPANASNAPSNAGNGADGGLNMSRNSSDPLDEFRLPDNVANTPVGRRTTESDSSVPGFGDGGGVNLD